MCALRDQMALPQIPYLYLFSSFVYAIFFTTSEAVCFVEQLTVWGGITDTLGV
jgi:hypothetical protein